MIQYSWNPLALMFLECGSGTPHSRPGRKTARNMAEVEDSGLLSRDPHFFY